MPIQILAVDVMAGGVGGAALAPSIRHQEPGSSSCAGTPTECINTNFLYETYLVFGVCTLVVTVQQLSI